MRLNVKALALTAAISWAAAVFLTTWWLIILGSSGLNILLVRVYPGYSVSPLGSIVGLIWGFVDGLVCGAILAWIYNAFLPKETKTATS